MRYLEKDQMQRKGGIGVNWGNKHGQMERQGGRAKKGGRKNFSVNRFLANRFG